MTPAEGLQCLKRPIEQLADAYLGQPEFPRSKKVIHDAIWGTQQLHPHEVAVLDSRLLQRLRYLHQTGLSYLTYPSTTHSRFEHTLGVLYQADRLSRALSEKYSKQEGQFPSSLPTKIRLAAILHDCSHGFFSHTSEEIYRLFPEVEACVGDGGEYEAKSPSEMLCTLILSSGPFERFFKELEKHLPALDFKPKDLATLILGEMPDKLQGYQTDIINGPFDADKLDYISRDGHYSGLPLGIDLDRLWYATEIQVLQAGDVPELDEPHRRLVIGRSGINSLEQIVAARMNLTASLYHHHKVRAAECMVKAAVEYAKKQGLPIAGSRMETAADFLRMTDLTFLADSERNPDATLRRLIGNLANRRLLKRALVITNISFEKPDDLEGGGEAAQEDDKTYNLVGELVLLTKKSGDMQRLRTLAERICADAGNPCLPEEVWIDLPDLPKTRDLSRTFVNIGTSAKPEFRTLSGFIPLDQWGKQYVINKWRGHVFCPPDCVEKISPVAEKVLADEFKITFNRYARLLANLPHQ